MTRVFFIIGLWLAACGPSEPTATPTPATATSIQLEANGVHVELALPLGWSSYTGVNSVVMSEYRHPMYEDGSIRGLVAEFWLPTLGELPLPREGDYTKAWKILQKVVESLAGRMTYSKPSPFNWSGYDAAYYVLVDAKGNSGIVILLLIADESQLLAIRISAPDDEIDRVRALLPSILGTLKINGMPMSPDALNAFPDPLPTPQPWKHEY